jgi:uncharacterized protein YciI
MPISPDDQGAQMKTKYYVFLHTPGPNWLTDKPITEQPLANHFRHMSQLESEGKLVLGGGFLDGSGAMGVLIADSQSEAEHIVANDPAVKDQIVKATVHPWYVTVAGRVEISDEG